MHGSCVGLGEETGDFSVCVSQGGGSGRGARADTALVPSVCRQGCRSDLIKFLSS